MLSSKRDKTLSLSLLSTLEKSEERERITIKMAVDIMITHVPLTHQIWQMSYEDCVYLVETNTE